MSARNPKATIMSPGLLIFFSTRTVWENRVGEYDRPSFGTVAQKFSSSLAKTHTHTKKTHSYPKDERLIMNGLSKRSGQDVPQIQIDGADVRHELLRLEVKLTEVFHLEGPHLGPYKMLQEVI